MTLSRRAAALLVGAACLPTAASAQIAVSPTGVNVASQGATTVFLTFGGLRSDQVPAEAFWCGELIDARPAIGQRCDPSSLFGSLPLRFDLSQRSGVAGFTDIMSIPPSVARRAYQAAAAGKTASFFYVRRFVSRSGAADEFVAVTCRLTAGGAGVPLALTDVRVAFDADAPVLSVGAAADPPPLHADITYTGTGQLHGRWEVVLPGEDLPTEQDLLTEASLPLEQRGTQRRFTPLSRFTVFLPPSGRARIPGPDPSRLPRNVDGTYLVLLRIEASDDVDSRSDLSAAGAGSGSVSSGAVAGFPLPTLRYVVGTASSVPDASPSQGLALIAPAAGATTGAQAQLVFAWEVLPRASRYRLEIERADGVPVLRALVPGSIAAYRPPPMLAERGAGAPLRWRVRAQDATGQEIARSAWRTLTLAP
jgi:hypothetical protein